MPPRARPPLHDQVTASAIMARMDGFEGYLDAIAKDAREGRDAALTLTARLTAENTQDALAKIWTRIEASDALHRADLQNSYQRLAEALAKRSSELDADRVALAVRLDSDRVALAVRVVSLENYRERLEGANGLLKWVGKYAPWLLNGVVGAFLAIMALKGKLAL